VLCGCEGAKCAGRRQPYGRDRRDPACVPKKLMVFASDTGETLRTRKGYGWDVTAGDFNLAEVSGAYAR